MAKEVQEFKEDLKRRTRAESRVSYFYYGRGLLY